MRKHFILLMSFCSILLFSEIYAQNNILKDGFYISTNPERKEVYLTDINEIRFSKSPRDLNNKPIGLSAIEDNFREERKKMVKSLFNKEEIDRFNMNPVIATVYINSKTKKIDAVSFRFRNLNLDEINSINTKKFSEYKEMLKSQITIQTLIFNREIAEHGHTSQSFRVFFHDAERDKKDSR